MQVTGRPPFLMIHHPPNLEASTCPTKHYFFSNIFTQMDALSSDLLHNIVMCYAGLVHHKNPNQSWCNSHNKVQLFLRPIPIHSNTSPLFNKYITTSFNMCRKIDTLALTHPTMTKNGGNIT